MTKLVLTSRKFSQILPSINIPKLKKVPLCALLSSNNPLLNQAQKFFSDRSSLFQFCCWEMLLLCPRLNTCFCSRCLSYCCTQLMFCLQIIWTLCCCFQLTVLRCDRYFAPHGEIILQPHPPETVK